MEFERPSQGRQGIQGWRCDYKLQIQVDGMETERLLNTPLRQGLCSLRSAPCCPASDTGPEHFQLQGGPWFWWQKAKETPNSSLPWRHLSMAFLISFSFTITHVRRTRKHEDGWDQSLWRVINTWLVKPWRLIMFQGCKWFTVIVSFTFLRLLNV